MWGSRAGRSGSPFGGLPFGGFGGGFGGHGGAPFGRPPFGPPWRPKARRGDVRMAVLAVLAEEASNGYQVIQAIADRTEGAWKPSPGSVYPTLQQLEDEGLVQADEADGRRLFRLTANGRTYVEEHADELAATWQSVSDGCGPPGETWGAVGHAMSAFWQVMQTGTDAQRAEARKVLEQAGRDLYGILAARDTGRDGGERS